MSKSTVYFMFIHFWLVNSIPQMMVSQFPCTPACYTSPPFSPLLQTPIFGSLLCGNWLVCGSLRFKAMVYFFFRCCSFFAQTMVSHFPIASQLLYLPSILPSVMEAYFWLVVVWAVFDRGPSKCNCVLYIYIFSIMWKAAPNDGTYSPHIHPNIFPTTSAIFWLIVGYCYPSAAT